MSGGGGGRRYGQSHCSTADVLDGYFNPVVVGQTAPLHLSAPPHSPLPAPNSHQTLSAPHQTINFRQVVPGIVIFLMVLHRIHINIAVHPTLKSTVDSIRYIRVC